MSEVLLRCLIAGIAGMVLGTSLIKLAGFARRWLDDEENQ